MLESVPQDIRDLGEAVRQASDLETARLEALLGIDEGTLKRNRLSTEHYLPALFREAFPGVSGEDEQRLAIAGRLFANAIIILDDIVDEPTRAWYLPLVVQLYLDACDRRLRELFGHDSPIWDTRSRLLRLHCRATAKGIALEQRGQPIAVREYARVTAEKNSLYHIITAGLAEMSGCWKWRQHINRSLTAACVSFQFLDDVVDWRDDLQSGQPNYLLNLAFSGTVPPDVPATDVAVRLVDSGALDTVVSLARRFGDRAVALARILGCPRWEIHCTSHREQIDRLAEALAKMKGEDFSG